MAAFASIDFGDARKNGMYILPVESENPLPEVKKEWLKKVWAVLAAAECDGLFEDPIVLSAHDQYKTQRVSLDTLPIPVATADNTNGDNIARVMRARAALEAENERKDAYRARVIRDKKAALGQALLLAFEANAPMTAEELKSVHAHVLVAATAVAPAKYDGVLMLGAYVARAGLNDATRQDAEAESLFKELTVEMPHNLTATQLGVHFNKFKLKCVPFLLRPLSNEGQVKWILDLLPRTGATASSRVLIISKLRDMNATGNVAEALKRASEACDDAHDPTLGTPDVGACIISNIRELQGQKGYFTSSAVKMHLSSIGTAFSAADLAAPVAVTPPAGMGAAPPSGKGKGKSGGPRSRVKLCEQSTSAVHKTHSSNSEGDHCSLMLSAPPASHTQSLSAARRSAL